MELEEMKSNWGKAGSQHKSQMELQSMTKLRNHPILNRIRVKLLMEAAWMIAIILFFTDAFDAQDKQLWARVVLIVGMMVHLINGVISYRVLLNPIKADNILLSLDRFLALLKKLSISSVVSAMMFGLSLILFFVSSIDLTQKKSLMLGGMMVTLIVLGYWSYRTWTGRIGKFRQVVSELE